jgi:DNA polymerase-4
MDRVVLHADCNSFFASCETLIRPELKNVPMAVCGDPENRHGIILAKNELAKKFDIKTAETVYQAKRKCPDLVLVRSHHGFYEEISKKCSAIYAEYTDMVEPFGIDESWLDVTGSRRLFGTGEEIAEKIRKRFKDEIGITCSIGISFNKVFAKLGSDYKKPDAQTVISRENFKETVWPLKASELLYLGKSAYEILKKHNIFTIGELAQADRKFIIKHLGKMGGMLHDYANGIDDSPVETVYTEHFPKSVSNGSTFRTDLKTAEEIKTGIMYLADSLHLRMKHQHIKCTAMYVQIKYADFTVVSRQRALDYSTNLMHDIFSVCHELFYEIYNGKPVRAITLGGTGTVSEDNRFMQFSLFDDGNRQKREKLESALDGIREKYGENSVNVGTLFNKKI